MDSTERILAAISFKPTDRVPLWDTYHFPEFTDNWRKYLNLSSDIQPSSYYGYDISICIGNESFFPSQIKVISVSNDYVISNDGWGRHVRTGKKAYFSETIDSLLKDGADPEELEFEPVKSEIRWQGFGEYVIRQRIFGKCVFAKIGGLYVRSHTLRREEDLLADMMLDEGFCNALFDKVAEHLTAMALETLHRADAWETGLFVYDDMASTYNTLFSPILFEKYSLPRYKKMINTCRKAGCKHFFLHSDGNIMPVIDRLLEAGFEGFHPLEPRSGLGLVKLREKYGKKLVLFGGVCNTEVLPRGDKREIERHVLPLVELAGDGGIILGMASITGDVSPEAYDYYMSLVKAWRNELSSN
jgi:hypothetical protein